MRPGDKYRTILLSVLIFLPGLTLAAETKNNAALGTMPLRSAQFDSVVVDIGSIQNFVANNTADFSSLYDPESFRIGRDDLKLASMQWSEGGYANNNYLFSGIFLIGYQNSTIRFNSATSNDFTIYRYNADRSAPFEVAFSMTDDSAGAFSNNIKTICQVYAWGNELRDDFLIYEYRIINRGDTLLSDLYAGLYMDFDISSAGGSIAGENYWMDDKSGFIFGENALKIPESISYMYDADDSNYPGNDKGGYLLPRESEGYAGSRILKSPPTKNGLGANRQSGHIWFSARRGQLSGAEFFQEMERQLFYLAPQLSADYRYLQTLGPWDLAAGDTLQLAFAIGVGNGIFGLQENLQSAYDLYGRHFQHKETPTILSSLPEEDVIPVITGENLSLQVRAKDPNQDSLLYVWSIDGQILDHQDTVLIYPSAELTEGTHYVRVDISDTKFYASREWAIIQQRPKVYQLGQNFPNPFNNSTSIPFELKLPSEISISVYSVTGEKVITLVREKIPAGNWVTKWNGDDENGVPVASGIYFYEILSADYSEHRKMLLIK